MVGGCAEGGGRCAEGSGGYAGCSEVVLKVAEVVLKVVEIVLKVVEIVSKMVEGASSVMTLKFHVGETIPHGCHVEIKRPRRPLTRALQMCKNVLSNVVIASEKGSTVLELIPVIMERGQRVIPKSSPGSN